MPGLEAVHTLAREPETKRSAIDQPSLAAAAQHAAPQGLADMLRPAAKRALDLLGFASQLMFNTFHNRRLHDWEHSGDLELAYGAARAHNRGMIEW